MVRDHHCPPPPPPPPPHSLARSLARRALSLSRSLARSLVRPPTPLHPTPPPAPPPNWPRAAECRVMRTSAWARCGSCTAPRPFTVPARSPRTTASVAASARPHGMPSREWCPVNARAAGHRPPTSSCSAAATTTRPRAHAPTRPPAHPPAHPPTAMLQGGECRRGRWREH